MRKNSNMETSPVSNEKMMVREGNMDFLKCWKVVSLFDIGSRDVVPVPVMGNDSFVHL